MNCVITVKGDGAGRNGHPKTDKTGPVSDFLVDNTVFYTAISKHLKDCTVCDPVAILEEYLSRRKREPKFKRSTSKSLVELALKYERLFIKKKLTFNPELINEIIWRSPFLAEYQGRIGISGIAKGMLHLFQDDRQAFDRTMGFSNDPKVKIIGQIVSQCSTVPTELDDLIQVAEVQLC